jgi:hypothetical protein
MCTPTTRHDAIHHLQDLAIHDNAASVVSALCSNASLPRLRALRLSFGGKADGPALARVWAAPWLSQLTRLDLGAAHGLVAGAVPRGGLHLPQLRELWLRGSWQPGGGLTPGQAAAVAACRLPRLESLGVCQPALGSIPALMAAPWAAGLSRVELDVEADWFDASVMAALARASSLTSLSLRFYLGGGRQQPGLDGPTMAALLAAPWRTSLQRLELTRQPLGGEPPTGDAARAALAGAALPALRALSLKNTGVTLAGLAELAGAPWARGLVAFEAEGSVMSPPLGPAVEDSWWQPAPAAGGGLEPAFAGVALPSLRSLSIEHCTLLTVDALLSFCRHTPWLSQLESLKIRGVAATPCDFKVWEAAAEAAGPFTLRPGADSSVTMRQGLTLVFDDSEPVDDNLLGFFQF